MTNTGPARRQLFCGRSPHDPSHALSLRAVGISWSLALITLFGSGCKALPSLCAQESWPARTPDHDSEARYYRDEALRMMTDSNRHSDLAVQYAEKAASGPDVCGETSRSTSSGSLPNLRTSRMHTGDHPPKGSPERKS